MADTDNNLVITNFRAIGKGHLIASFDVEIVPWHAKLFGCTWHRWENGYERVNFPAREWKDAAGKRAFAAAFNFTDEAVAERFQKGVLIQLTRMNDGR